MADSSSARSLQNMLIAAAVSVVIVFLACVAVNMIFARPAPPAPTAAQLASNAAPQDDARALEEQARQAARAKAERVQRENEQAAQDQARRDQKLQEALIARQATAEQERKDAAWAKFYKKPKKCDNPYDDKVIVECSNHYLQEQARFEKLFADRKL